MINTNNTSKKQIDFLKIIFFLRTFILLLFVFLTISTEFIKGGLLVIILVSLILILCLIQIFSMMSISDSYIGKKESCKINNVKKINSLEKIKGHC